MTSIRAALVILLDACTPEADGTVRPGPGPVAGPTAHTGSAPANTATGPVPVVVTPSMPRAGMAPLSCVAPEGAEVGRGQR